MLTIKFASGAEGGSRTRTPLRTTDFKSLEHHMTTCYYMILGSFNRRLAVKASLRHTWYHHVTPSSFPHLSRAEIPITHDTRDSSYAALGIGYEIALLHE
jgi:hypothetical protein